MARRLLLIRHGQYDEREEGTKDLTALGRKQAKRIGKSLEFDRIDAVYASTMLRARTTAGLIAEDRNLPVQTTPLLCECIPTKIGFYIPPDTIAEGKRQADRAFDRFFKKSRILRTELLVCHGNIIRYLVARALRVPGTTWRKMAIYHASITEIRIHSDGRAVLFSYNDVAHLPHKLRTMSGARPNQLKIVTKRSIEKVKPNS
jgi:serine/threonine-protein phosphatase PGAM5